MSEKKTYVAMVLDESGSMSSIKEQAIGMFNEQRDAVVNDAQKAGVKGLSLVTFGSGPGVVKVIHDNAAPHIVQRLDGMTYRPSGSTPMRDGIGRAIALLEAQDDGGEDTAFLVVVVTDGMENASQEWTASALSEKVKQLQDTGRWTFGLFGADGLDLSSLKETSGLGHVPVGNVATYTPDAQGTAGASFRNVGAIVNYMSSREAGLTATTSYVED